MSERGKQLTCDCPAYSFPHRLGGGNCFGNEWAEFYFYHINDECEYCNHNNNGCEVALGLESINNCEGYKSMLSDNSMEIYPLNLEKLYSNDERV